MKSIQILFFTICVFVFLFIPPFTAFSKTIEYNLTIEEQDITILDKTSHGMTINGNIPGPVLRFTEGDMARITVNNKMDMDTSIHWHGLLVPPEMDGVPFISYPPIAPGTTFIYEFPIRQSGTYWYHSHTHLQEQQGLYGSIVIKPKTKNISVDKEVVVLLSDWTTENPDAIIKTLKSGSEWYSLQKGSSQSILGAAKQGELGTYLGRELQRMPPMDIADVAYDYFLVNGKPQSMLPASPHEKIRLRIINGSATTYFYIEFAGGPVKIISADGQDIHPIMEKRFLIGVAETYDIIVTLPKSGRFELRSTAHDGSGYSSFWIGSGMKNAAPDVPKPNLYMGMGHGESNNIFSLTPQEVMGRSDKMIEKGHFDSPGMMGMEHSPEMKAMGHAANSEMAMNMPKEKMENMNKMEKMTQPTPAHLMKHEEKQSNNSSMDVKIKGGKSFSSNFGLMASDVSSSDALSNDGMGSERPWPPYAKLRSKTLTNFDENKPVRELRFTLDGDMERYVWFLNNKPLSESDSILIKEGKIVRFIMINRTMMHHPMHLHGHFFRVLNGQNDYAPLKHTVDVAPMSTTVIEFNANEVGDWFFHCHLLYHMKSGMARKLHYENYVPSDAVSKVSSNLFKDPWYFWGDANILSNMTEGLLTFANTRNTLSLGWEAGWQNVENTKWEGTLIYDRYINRFFSLFAGGFMEGEDSQEEETKAILGIFYLLPLNIESRTWIDSTGEARFMVEKELMLTPRISLDAEVQYDTKEAWESSFGLSYLLHKNVSLTTQWHSVYEWGAGISVRF